MACSSVIIIGAPRSGTNMLRDMLIALPDVGTWPCDEINYIWRHGNVSYPSDEFTPDMATMKIQSYIQRQFRKISVGADLDIVIEKTCANSLRIGFVNNIIPDAKYIFIVRDGIDAVGSALKGWKAGLDIQYVMQKARYVPPFDLPYYATRYLLNHFHRIVSQESRLLLWGPAIDNMDFLLNKYSLPEVCALQWQACVMNAERDLAIIPSNKIIRLRYEEFVMDPMEEFARLADFLGKHVPDPVNNYLKDSVRQDSIGKGRRALGDIEIKNIKAIIDNTLEKYGYE